MRAVPAAMPRSIHAPSRSQHMSNSTFAVGPLNLYSVDSPTYYILFASQRVVVGIPLYISFDRSLAPSSALQ